MKEPRVECAFYLLYPEQERLGQWCVVKRGEFNSYFRYRSTHTVPRLNGSFVPDEIASQARVDYRNLALIPVGHELDFFE